jgi:hypothetical protein
MITFEEFCRDANGPKTYDNYEAFLRFMKRAQCEDATSWREAHEKICATFDMITEEVEVDNALGLDHLRKVMDRA